METLSFAGRFNRGQILDEIRRAAPSLVTIRSDGRNKDEATSMEILFNNALDAPFITATVFAHNPDASQQLIDSIDTMDLAALRAVVKRLVVERGTL